MKKKSLVLAIICMATVSLCYTNCSLIKFENTSTVGNPLTASNKMVQAVCNTIKRCHSDVQVSQCETQLLNTSGFDKAFGLASAYSTLSTIIQAETVGTLAGNENQSNICSGAIQELNCSSTEVTAAYQPSLNNPYQDAAALIPAASCAQILVPSVNVTVPIELLATGLASNTTTTTFERTQTNFNPQDYDGTVEYFFEVTAKNKSNSAASVNLLDSSGSIIAGITVFQSSVWTRLRTPVLNSINQGALKVQLEGTTAASDLEVTAARLLVKQTGATKTKIYIPLVGGFSGQTFNTDDKTAMVDMGMNGYDTINSSHYYGLWRKNNAAFSEIDSGTPWTYEAVAAVESTGGLAYTALYNYSKSLVLPQTELTTARTTPTLLSVDFADNATNFNDQDLIDSRIHFDTVNPNTAILYKAGLWLKLTKLAHGEIYHRYSRTIWLNNSAASPEVDSPILLDLNSFKGPVQVFNEVTGFLFSQGSAGCSENLYDLSGNPFGDAGTVVADSKLSFATHQRELKRSSQLLMNSGSNYSLYNDDSYGSAACVFTNNNIVIKF
ncbi:MAG: hypothetical protein ACXVCP_09740 [Bdellovibrio sp.]